MMLMQGAATGALAGLLAEEGGMPSALWAGKRRQEPVRMRFGVAVDDWDYSLELGLPRPTEAAFLTDPIVKLERINLNERRRRVTMLERKGPTAWLRNAEGRRVPYEFELLASETALSQLRDPLAYPEQAVLRQELQGWRFYHHFRTDADSPLRNPQVGVCTPTLSSDGRDLVATLATIRFLGEAEGLDQAIADAFPGAALEIEEQRGRYELGLKMPGFFRAFDARELSDGTLRYLCLVAALLSHRLPRFLALNEPEASLHPDLLEPLAKLIAQAAQRTQIWIVTHSDALAGHLQAHAGCAPRRVMMRDGVTLIEGLTMGGEFVNEKCGCG
jgi:predicted ATPase